MRKVIIVLAVVLVVFALSGAVTCEEAQDISWLDGTTWNKTNSPFEGYKIKITGEKRGEKGGGRP
jgi:hypothetical protein